MSAELVFAESPERCGKRTFLRDLDMARWTTSMNESIVCHSKIKKKKMIQRCKISNKIYLLAFVISSRWKVSCDSELGTLTD